MLMPTISSPSVDSVIIAVSTPGVPKFYAKAFGTEDSCPETYFDFDKDTLFVDYGRDRMFEMR